MRVGHLRNVARGEDFLLRWVAVRRLGPVPLPSLTGPISIACGATGELPGQRSV